MPEKRPKQPKGPAARTEQPKAPLTSVNEVLAWARESDPNMIKLRCFDVCNAQGEPVYAAKKGLRSKQIVNFRVGEEGLTAYVGVALPEFEIALRQPIESEEGAALFSAWLERVGGDAFRESPISFTPEAEPDAAVAADTSGTESEASPAEGGRSDEVKTPPSAPNISERTTVAYLAKIRETLDMLSNTDDQSPGAIARRSRFEDRLHEMFLQTGIVERLANLTLGESEVSAQSGLQVLQLNAPRVGGAVGRPAANPMDLMPTVAIRLYQRTQPVAGDHTITELPDPYALKIGAVLKEVLELENVEKGNELREALQELGAGQVRLEVVAWREQAGEKRQIVVAVGGAFVPKREGTA